MTLRHTILFIPKGEKDVVSIQIFVLNEEGDTTGYWNIDENKVLLSPSHYADFRKCQTQAAQKKFFNQLIKVSDRLI